MLYIGTADGVNAIDTATGARLWAYITTGGAPVVANGMVYIGTADGHVDAFALPGGPAAPARPSQNSLHPDGSLPQQR